MNILFNDYLNAIENKDEIVEHQIVVKGDTTGDANINLNDITRLYHYYKKIEQMDEPFILAGDVANNDIINYLINKARSFIFSTSIPPINIAWSNWLLTEKKELLLKQKNKLINLSNNVRKTVETISNSHIIPIIIGTNSDTIKLAEKLKSEGYYIPAIRPPTVPEGSARLRISLTANINLEDIKKVIGIIREF